MSTASRSEMAVSYLWLQASALTFLVGFAVLGYLAMRVYQDHPPVPSKVVTDSSQTLFTNEDIRSGQELFLSYGLMQYGSIYGHGAYLGPDFTADYLHRQAVEMKRGYGDNAEAEVRVRRELQANRYDPASDTLTWTDGQAQAFAALREHYEQTVLNRQASGGGGLGPHAVIDPEQSRKIVTFIGWTAWTAAARRPGRPHSYTNNWPPEPLAGNELTSEAVVWSTLSIIALLGGTGLLLALFGRYSQSLGWHAAETGLVVRAKTAGPSNIGNLLAGEGIPATAGFGVPYEGLHGIDERAHLAELPTVYSVYQRALCALLGAS